MNTSRAKSQGSSRAKSQGWAAVNLKQHHEQLPQADPFPPLLQTTNSTISPLPHATLPVRSFSSVVQSSAHTWPEHALILDDTRKASALLTQMQWETKEKKKSYGFQCNQREHDTSLLQSSSDFAADIAALSSTLEDALKSTAPQGSQAATASMKLILGHLKSLPIEPEWEENDDVYLTHRRNALKMMRLASRHSRAATNAFIRGDHCIAQHKSLKARKEWLDAEQLNSKAAKEILSLRNSEDNPCKLDLHGLHAAEAVQALQEHLQKIETQLPMIRQLASSSVKTKDGIVSSLNVPLDSMTVENTNIHSTRFRQRPSPLQVVTGVGNHSRGQASLPAAIRSFLIEKRYKFDETRPGVVTVYPKFHPR
ncbi:smr (Small MutS Related) domain-containing protein [Euphorbia peplus]|nr:smr (Small MutS Related) domain-containing protein [Euphorbia peplus]